jgi:ATP-dependent Clp protease ATP-binding subunit ClpB
LQVLDDGRITDSQGRTVDFKNTIIILTSNIGSNHILEGIDESGQIAPTARQAVERQVKNQFRPEFINRLDEIVFYKPLTRDEIWRIIDLMVAELNQRLAERQLTVTLTPAAKEFITEIGYDPVFGARPLKRMLQRRVETPISRLIIADQAPPRSTLRVDMKDNEFIVSVS